MRYMLLSICFCVLMAGCGKSDAIVIPKETVAALKPGDVRGMGLGAGKTNTTPPKK
ncbi:MAG TPA: hypothetical protein PLN21_11715 [Gemmatales bacterium]|nr:hypothetical protein [Gemmatales bacterium]